jgi:hypothetical protein
VRSSLPRLSIGEICVVNTFLRDGDHSKPVFDAGSGSCTFAVGGVPVGSGATFDQQFPMGTL